MRHSAGDAALALAMTGKACVEQHQHMQDKACLTLLLRTQSEQRSVQISSSVPCINSVVTNPMQLRSNTVLFIRFEDFDYKQNTEVCVEECGRVGECTFILLLQV